MSVEIDRRELDPLWVPESARVGEPVPVMIRKEQDHAWRRPPKGRRGCAVCGRARHHVDHLGAPPSLNIFTSQNAGQVMVYRGWKAAWSAVLDELLRDARLSKPLGRVMVEGRVCFPTRTRRDQGNYRFLIEKALGDTLTAGGWLEDDDWSRYEFGNLAYGYARGRSWIELVIFPGWTPADTSAEARPAQASLL